MELVLHIDDDVADIIKNSLAISYNELEAINITKCLFDTIFYNDKLGYFFKVIESVNNLNDELRNIVCRDSCM